MADSLQTAETKVTSEVATAKSWLLLHERLLITVLVILASLFVCNKVFDHMATKDKDKAAVTQQILQQQTDSNKLLAAQVAQTQQQYTQLSAQLNQQNAQLAQATQTRTIVLQQQQAADKVAPLPDIATRLAQLAKIDPSTVQSTPQGIAITPDSARATVAQLEEAPVLQQNLSDSQLQNENLQKIISESDILNSQLTNQVTGLNAQIVDQKTACDANVKAVKAEARKGKFKTFFIGFGTGYVAGLVTKIVVK